jgi:hypothetical protein
VYDGDWLVHLTELVRDVRNPRHWHVPATVWGLGVTSMLTDVSSEMVLSVLPAFLVLAGGLAPLTLGVAAGVHEGGPMLAAWAGGLMADQSRRRKLTAGSGYALSAICRLGWFTLSGRSVAAIAMLILGDRVGKAIRAAPRDALISLSVQPSQLATAFGVHRAMDAAGAAIGPMLAFVLLWRLPHRYDGQYAWLWRSQSRRLVPPAVHAVSDDVNRGYPLSTLERRANKVSASATP